ncbi:hypothetical protein FHU41_000039 [Psychromicrobium silvestre]|uniref:Secreted protein n=1 Tax=Psychromicrobium silvestre TaxID=1645614 RepID=A0A7Y9LQN9_9MICC|nr:hypothetical protein [Psychromicrobium silvestre]NYE93818.1 hypothetical protein [Psychromicrobium silvestre]
MKSLKKAASLGAGITLLGLAMFATTPAQAAVVCGSEPLSSGVTMSAEATPMCGATSPMPTYWVCPPRDPSVKVWVSTPWCP